MGLSPLLVSEVFDIIQQLKETGTTIFLVEQNAMAALRIADRGYVLETGQVSVSGKGSDLLEDDRVKSAYLGL
jgi:branched-chain amino acid transport system ATP-binding protein